MKNGSATHILGLLLVAATSSSARKYHGADEFGGSSVHEVRHPAGAHGGAGVPDHAREHRPSPRAHGVVMEDSMYSHAMLHEHVHHGQAPVGLDVGLMHPLPHYLIGFMKWTYEFGVSFGNVDEATHALKNFAKADDRIFEHNAEEAGYTMAHNAYSHLSWQEFREHFGIGRPMVARNTQRGESAPRVMLRGQELPEEVDWVSKGGVTEVKNQGSCGSCWSFSTTGAMEGAHFIKYGNLAVLSEQELVDCDSYDMGCFGGLMDHSFEWIQENGGICSEEDYPYTAEGDKCSETSCENVPGTMVDKWIDVDHDSEEALMTAVAQQPVSIAIEADEMSFQLYSGGVLTAACGTNLDHGVLLVGYGVSEDGVKYWKVKNSWGAEWGADGYILLKREAAQEGGECGVLMQASYPVLA